MANIILFNKPFHVLSQFTDTQERTTLSTFIKRKDFYAAGRLDYDSEGLLILTNNGNVQHFIAHPRKKLPKTYFVQVEGVPESSHILELRQGINLKDGITKPAKATLVDEPEWLWERTPPIRERANIPTSWIKLSINEGRNRQVRRMTAAIGFPTLRLIRYAIGNWTIEKLAPGQYREEEVFVPVNTR